MVIVVDTISDGGSPEVESSDIEPLRYKAQSEDVQRYDIGLPSVSHYFVKHSAKKLAGQSVKAMSN